MALILALLGGVASILYCRRALRLLDEAYQESFSHTDHSARSGMDVCSHDLP